MRTADYLPGAMEADELNNAPYRVAFLYDSYEQYLLFLEKFASRLYIECFNSPQGILEALHIGFPADAIIASVDNGGWDLLAALRSSSNFANIPILLVTKELTPEIIEEARKQKADDIFDEKFEEGDLLVRLHYLFQKKWHLAGSMAERVKDLTVETPLWKRSWDVLLSGIALILLSPIFLIVALAIRLDSKGPILYKSKRVGGGFKVFDLYKFRTMRVNADQLIKKIAAENIYNREQNNASFLDSTLCEDCCNAGFKECQRPLFHDGQQICEKAFRRQKEQQAAFMKFQNDPRVTKVGRFLRNTSIDELPQLLNILKGDMSLIGNRPLPIYEAEKLTKDNQILRFAGPAGLTGLWQVTKRSKKAGDISEEERVALDIYYVENLSFWLDLKIFFKTFPALLQTENV